MEQMGNMGQNQTPYKAGYEYLIAWKITVPIYDYTVVFCNRCCGLTLPSFPPLPTSPHLAVNLLIDLTKTACYFQDKLIVSLKEKHTKEGGFSENLLKKRLEYRKNSF